VMLGPGEAAAEQRTICDLSQEELGDGCPQGYGGLHRMGQ
jgi:hypothetical protein